jgi:hypothetical protein
VLGARGWPTGLSSSGVCVPAMVVAPSPRDTPIPLISQGVADAQRHTPAGPIRHYSEPPPRSGGPS